MLNIGNIRFLFQNEDGYNINIYKTNFNYSIYLKISSLFLHNIQGVMIYSSKWRFNLDRL